MSNRYSYHRWTSKEDQQLLKELKKYERHIPKAVIINIAEKLGVTVSAVKCRKRKLFKDSGKQINHKWNKESENVVVKCVKEYPYNLTLAFADAALLLHTTIQAVQWRYYHIILPKQRKPLFAFITYKSHMFNHKNVFKHKYKRQKNDVGFWGKILTLFSTSDK